MSSIALSPRVLGVMARLQVDAWTAEVVGAMRERGIRPVLLKGPAVARWLYAEDPDLRSYVDADLIVSPSDFDAARRLLADLGFVAALPAPIEDVVWHSRAYARERDGANVDLHHKFHGMQAVTDEDAWRAVSTHSEVMCVSGVDVEVPGIPARVLHLVLHLEPEDGPNSQNWRDLLRGLDRVPREDWSAALALARQLGIEHEMGVRLRRLPEGAALADELGIARKASRYYQLAVAVERGDAPRSVRSIWGFLSLPNISSRLAYIVAKLTPDERALREQSMLARMGHVRIARALHIFGVAARLPTTLIAWVRYYRE
jgi:hypothetical protein